MIQSIKPIKRSREDFLKKRRPDVYNNCTRIGGNVEDIRMRLGKSEKVERNNIRSFAETEASRNITGYFSEANKHISKEFNEEAFKYNMNEARKAIDAFERSAGYKKLPQKAKERFRNFFDDYKKSLRKHFGIKKNCLDEVSTQAKIASTLGNYKTMFESIWKLKSAGVIVSKPEQYKMRRTIRQARWTSQRKAKEETVIIPLEQLLSFSV